MKLVLIESPYAGDVDRNVAYARACMKDCLDRDEAPFASHLLYTQLGVLDDTIQDERVKGINAGLLWGKAAEMTAVYIDLGITPGMKEGIDRARAERRSIVYRSLNTKNVVQDDGYTNFDFFGFVNTGFDPHGTIATETED